MNTVNNGSPISVKPFSTPARTKRRVEIGAAFDPNLRLPTREEMVKKPQQKPRETIQVNPPIQPNLVNLDTQPDMSKFKLPEEISNNPDLAKFDEELFEKEELVQNLVEMRVDDRIDDSPFSERIALPSNGIFYNYNSVTIRPFRVPELALIYKAKKNRDLTLLNDTVGKTINVDIRNLWPVDARWVMYWHRMNSFIKTPYLAAWESIYGNSNKTKITLTDVAVTPISMTKKEYQDWQLRGLKIPTVRDQEHLETFKAKLSEEDLWLYERAVFLQGEDLHQQKALLESDEGVNLLYAIKEFMQAIAPGAIVETAKVKDEQFEYEPCVKKLAAELEVINNILSTELGLNANAEELLLNKQISIVKEIDRLSQYISNPGEAEPLLETITLRLGLLDFFPDVF